MTDKPKYYIVSFSGGKDSTAMLLHMIELNMPIDEIIFCDTTVEFPEMYEHLDKVEKYIGRKITRLRQEHDFEYYLLEYKVKVKDSTKKNKPNYHIGYSFPWAHMRWCTQIFKTLAIRKHLEDISKKFEVVHYIGIAFDEQKRIENKVYPSSCFPLVEWGWTEKDCLDYCYSKGFTWGGLYEKFSRVSCWCCPLQSLASLRSLYYNFPNLWNKLREWQVKTWHTFKGNTSIFDLEERFKLEEERLAKGLPIGRNRDFHKELKERLDTYNKEK